jgi:hypothetical protein
MFYDFDVQVIISGKTPNGPVKFNTFTWTSAAEYMLEEGGLVHLACGDAHVILPFAKLHPAELTPIADNFPSTDAG